MQKKQIQPFLRFKKQNAILSIKKSIDEYNQYFFCIYWVNPIKTSGYAGGIRELWLQAKTFYAIIILRPPRHKEA